MSSPLIHLRGGESSLIFSTANEILSIAYWGRALDEADDELVLAKIQAIAPCNFDEAISAGVMREHSRGFMGHPAISGHRDGEKWSTLFALTKVDRDESSITAHLSDAFAELELTLAYSLSEFDVLKVEAKLDNRGDSSYNLQEFLYWLPLPDYVSESMDFTGRWTRERQPQRAEIPFGLTTREGREGRTGHAYTIAHLALTPQTNFQSGEVWALSTAWSGNSQHFIERLPSGEQSIGAGELLMPGEAILEPHTSFHLAPIVASYSSQGLDGLSHNYYRQIRSRPTHPTKFKPRPLTLNMWEAVYFDHDEAKIREIVEEAAEVGVERVVLDDGWFHSRRDDTAGLGDWVVDPAVWPHGLTPIIEFIRSKGMEFGLWFEGEMINPDSDLYREHPDWILSEGGRTPPLFRNQLVLDLTNPEAYQYLFNQIDAILSTHAISYIKWDHNRVLVDAGSKGRAALHNQTAAIYRLFDELKAKHQGLEIESCSSGGGRIDLGMIDHADRFWTSDTNDALERQGIQRWTGLVIPPELLGTHIGPRVSHQTGRRQPLGFRAITALFGHAGIEWNIADATLPEIEGLKRWATLYKAKRELLHSGRAVRVDRRESSDHLYGVIAQDQSEALFAFAQLQTPATTYVEMARIPGLKANARYRVKLHAGAARTAQIDDPAWVKEPEGIVMTGQALAQQGLRLPILAPENALLLSITIDYS